MVLASTLALKLFSLDDLMGRFIEQSEDVELFLAALGKEKKKKRFFHHVENTEHFLQEQLGQNDIILGW